MPIKRYADTSAVSLAYALSNAADESELDIEEMRYIPYTSEGFAMSKDSKQSTAVSGDRRPGGSKNTKGSASGSAGLEMGHTPFVVDMLQLAMMSEWEDETEDDGSGNTTPTGARFITDGEDMQFFFAEKRAKNVVGGVNKNFLERYFGNAINEMTVEIPSSDLVSMSVNTMAAFADSISADASSDEDAGGIATTYLKPEPYEIADGANNISSIVIKDSEGNPMEVTYSKLTLTISNNVREQAGIGHEFTAGMSMGKVNASLSGTIYFFDDSILKAHMGNKRMSAEVNLKTDEGSFKVHLPMLKAEAPSANAGGENQDYTQDLTLNAERGKVNLNGENRECVIAIVEEPLAA